MEKLQAALHKARRDRQDAREAVAPAAPKVSEQLTGPWRSLPALHLVSEDLLRNRVVSHTASKDSMPIDMLRTKVQLTMRARGWKRVAITSAEKGVGKSTLACNLALSLCRQQSTRTMFIDLDMRMPSVAKILNQKSDSGIESVLSGITPPNQHLKCFSGNLAISMSNEKVFDPMRYTMGPELEKTLDMFEREYDPDLIICDLPPLLSADENQAILKLMDCAIIVVRAEKTRMQSLDKCEKTLVEYCNSLGVVVNGCHYVNDQKLYGDESYY